MAALALARGDGRYAKLLRSLARVNLLILGPRTWSGDWGPEPLGPEQRRDLLEIVEDRYDTGSLLITSQLPIERWYEIIGDPTLADAILDRVVHNAYRIELKGNSLRKRRAAEIVGWAGGELRYVTEYKGEQPCHAVANQPVNGRWPVPSDKRATGPPEPASPASDIPAGHARGLKAHSEPIGDRDPSDGATLSPSSLPYRRSVLPGSTSCRRQPRARQLAKRCKRLSISISTNWAPSNRRAALAEIEPTLDGNPAMAAFVALALDPTIHSWHHPNDPLGDATPAAFRSEWWPLWNRNGWPPSNRNTRPASSESATSSWSALGDHAGAPSVGVEAERPKSWAKLKEVPVPAAELP
jgi:hypothetical protein